jgi:hypothetical protein
MKSVLFSFGLILVLNPLMAFAEDIIAQSPVETEVIEQILDKAVVTQRDELVIQVKNGKSYSFDMIPGREEMRESLGLKVPEKLKVKILSQGGTLEEVDPLAPFESMSEESKIQFQKTRVMFLQGAARTLNSVKFALGTGSLVGDSLSFVKVKTLNIFGRKSETQTNLQKNFEVRSREAVGSVLKALDYKLFAQAPLVVDSNEFGLSLSLGLIAETGLLRQGGGGAEELGLSLAFNKQNRAFVFEIFHNSESFQNTKAAVSVVGFVGKGGLTLGKRQGTETLMGSSFYPPAVPGFSSASADYFFAGASTSLGLPPPPLADLLTFTNKFERHTWIRITASPITKGFVRLQIGDVKGSFLLILHRFSDVYHYVMEKVFFHRRTCKAVFVN